jgi:autotransporter-associated beta strand protein
VNGIINAAGASALTIGTGTNNGTLTAKTDGGELILHNFSSTTMTVNSVIADNGTASALTKAGTGVVMVTGANSYSGATFVNQGVLEVGGATGALAGTTSVTINADGVVLLSSTSTDTGGQINDSAAIFLAGGTIEAGVDGIDESVGALTLSLDSTIDFGVLTGTNSFRFADSTGLWTSETTLNILNYTVDSDHLYFGDIAEAGVDLDQLIQINFYSGNSVDPGDFLGTASYLAAGEVGIPAVPEPSTTALVLCFLLVLIGFRERRRIALICGR